MNSFNPKENIQDEFNKVLTSLIPKNGRLVIFIDELDRCRPTYAVKLLERVQHYFENERITFVFSVNLLELNNTIKKFYGSEFDGDRYLDRFFDFVIYLPEPDFSKYYQEVLNVPSTKITLFDSYRKDITKYFDFSLRELNHFYSRTSIVLQSIIARISKTPLFAETKGEEIINVFIIPYFIALKMINSKLFSDTISGIDDNSFIEFIGTNKLFKKYVGLDEDNDNDSKICAQKIYHGLFVDADNSKNINIGDGIVIINSERNKKRICDMISLVSDGAMYKNI